MREPKRRKEVSERRMKEPKRRKEIFRATERAEVIGKNDQSDGKSEAALRITPRKVPSHTGNQPHIMVIVHIKGVKE